MPLALLVGPDLCHPNRSGQRGRCFHIGTRKRKHGPRASLPTTQERREWRRAKRVAINVETGKRIKDAMDARGVRALDVAVATGISRSFVYNLIKGEAGPSREVLSKLADCLGVTTLDLDPREAQWAAFRERARLVKEKPPEPPRKGGRPRRLKAATAEHQAYVDRAAGIPLWSSSETDLERVCPSCGHVGMGISKRGRLFTWYGCPACQRLFRAPNGEDYDGLDLDPRDDLGG